MVTKQSFNFSDSLVMKELERIGREKKLVIEDDEFYVPVIQKKASNRLEKSGNLIADILSLANELEGRGFKKQAQSLIGKALILKRAMSDAGTETLYDFWKETGEGFIEHAQRNSDGGAEGYKVKNINEVKKVFEESVKHEPTGDNRAAKLAKMVEYIVKNAQDVSTKDLVARNIIIYDAWYGHPNGSFIKTLQEKGLVNDGLSVTDSATEENVRNILSSNIKAFDDLSVLPSINNLINTKRALDNKDQKSQSMYIKIIVSNNIAAATNQLNSYWDDEFASFFDFRIPEHDVLEKLSASFATNSNVGAFEYNVPADAKRVKELMSTFGSSIVKFLGRPMWKISSLSSSGKALTAAFYNATTKFSAEIGQVINEYLQNKDDFADKLNKLNSAKNKAAAMASQLKEAIDFFSENGKIDFVRLLNSLYKTFLPIKNLNLQQTLENITQIIRENVDKGSNIELVSTDLDMLYATKLQPIMAQIDAAKKGK